MIWIPNGWAGRLGVAGTALRIAVFRVSTNVTKLFPTVTAGIGLGNTVEFPGRPETLKFTAFPKPFESVGPNITLIANDCPAVTLVGLAAMVMVKSSTVKVTCSALAPPPGVGFVTATFGVPLAAMSEAGTATTICVGEIVVGVSAWLVPRVTVAPATKPVPVIVIVNPAPPGACVGDTDVIVGTGLFTVKISGFEGPVVGAGFMTVTFTVALAAVAAAGICTMICPAVIEVGTKPSFDPKFTVAPARKPLPLIVNLNATPPAVVLVGESEARDGTGFSIVNGIALEVPPPGAGLVTETLMLAPVAMSAVGIVTAICVAVTEVGVSGPNDPNVTVAPVPKFVPVIVSVKAPPPEVALAGESWVMVGTGLSTVKV
jgi:hypothetical protein